MYRLFVPGTLTALQSASFYGKEPRDLNCSKFLLQKIRKVEYEALTTTKQDIYPSLIDNMHFSFLSDILLGCYPPIWKDRLDQLIKTVGNDQRGDLSKYRGKKLFVICLYIYQYGRRQLLILPLKN